MEIDKKSHDEPANLTDPQKRNFWQRLKHSIIYGGEQTFFCLATDPLEPVVNSWYQNKHGDKQHSVSNWQTYSSEFIGDGAAFFAYVAIKTMLAAPVNWAIGGVRAIASPLLEWKAQKSVKRWATEHNVEENDPRYKERLEQYKTLGAEGVVDSSIIASSAAGLNLLAQRHLLKNEQSYGTMLKGKIAGVAMTFAAMALTGFLFPRAKRKVERAIENNVIDPVMNMLRSNVGDVEEVAATQMQESPATLTPEKRDGLLKLAADHLAKIDLNDPAQVNKVLCAQKEVYQALLTSFAAEGYLVSVMEREHYEVIEKNYKHGTDINRTADMEASRASVQKAASAKRADLKAFLALMDDPAFIAEAKQAAKSGNIPTIRNKTISSEEQDSLSNRLLQTARSAPDQTQAIFDKAEAQSLEHKALAHSVEPEGIVTRILAGEMKKQLPNHDPKDVENIAKEYMEYYNKEELGMAAQFKTDSKAVQHAVERSQSLRNKYAPSASSSAMLAS